MKKKYSRSIAFLVSVGLVLSLASATDLQNIESITPQGSQDIFVNGTLNLNNNPLLTTSTLDGVDLDNPGNALVINSNQYEVDSNSIAVSELNTGDVDDRYLNRGSSDSMLGNINMNNNDIDNVNLLNGASPWSYDGDFLYSPSATCEDLGWSEIGTGTGNAPSKWACFENAALHNGGDTASWDEANNKAVSWGGVLPTRAELDSTDGQGNGWDSDWLWTRESCGEGKHYAMKREGSGNPGSLRCDDDSTNNKYTAVSYYRDGRTNYGSSINYGYEVPIGSEAYNAVDMNNNNINNIGGLQGCSSGQYVGGDGNCKNDNTGTDSQDLSNNLDTSPGVGYVEHGIQITGGSNTVARDYYDPNTDTQNLGTSGNQITLGNGGSITAPYANNADQLDGVQLANIDWGNTALARSEVSVSDLGAADANLNMNNYNVNSVSAINNGGSTVNTGGTINVGSGSVTASQRMCIGDRCA